MRYRLRRKSDGRIIQFTNYLTQAVAEHRYYGLDEHEIIDRHGNVVTPKRNYFIFNQKTGRTEQQ